MIDDEWTEELEECRRYKERIECERCIERLKCEEELK